MLQKLKELLLEHTLTLVVIPSLALFGTLFWTAMPTLLAPLWSRLEPQKLQRILGLSLLSVLVLLAYAFYLHRKLKTKLRVMYGIQWDREDNPYCPGCDKPLSNYEDNPYVGIGFHCLTCKALVSMYEPDGTLITLKTLRRLMSSNSN